MIRRTLLRYVRLMVWAVRLSSVCLSVSRLSVVYDVVAPYPFLPHDAAHSATYAVVRCPSVHPPVCLSHSCIVSIETSKHVLDLFLASVRATILAFLHTKRYENIPTRRKFSNQGVECW